VDWIYLSQNEEIWRGIKMGQWKFRSIKEGNFRLTQNISISEDGHRFVELFSVVSRKQPHGHADILITLQAKIWSEYYRKNI
jgi:hypothetical protein